MPELVNQTEIHEQSLSSDPAEREEAAKQFNWKHHFFVDKNQAWTDVLRLINDEVEAVVGWASNAIRLIFIEVPDKNRAWTDLHELGSHKNLEVRKGAAEAFAIGFAYIPDQFKHDAWCDLHQLIYDDASEVRCGAVNSLLQAYPHILVADKAEAWSDLHRCTIDMDLDVREEATRVLGYLFPLITHLTEGWSDLHRLASDNNKDIKRAAAVALGKAFPFIPDKNGAWTDLHKLTQDEHNSVRGWAGWALSLAYSCIPEVHRSEAWSDIHRLTRDDNGEVREGAATAIILVIDAIPDKIDAVSDLHRLSRDEYRKVRWRVAGALGSAFIHFPDRRQAWIDLRMLINDRFPEVRRTAIVSLSKVFSLLPSGSRDEALADLHQLVKDKDSDVRMYTYYSLGKMSVFSATEMDDIDTLKKELAAAVSYFEKSTQEGTVNCPAKFCHPFYRTYFAITFQDVEGDEVQRYIAKAKEAVGGSESKDELLHAIENLAEALRQSQCLKAKSVEDVASELNTYRWYCDRAAEHMAAAESGAPGAVKLLRKCNPIIEEKIEATIAEIQKTAREICRVTRGSGTKYEAPGAEINREAKSLSPEAPINAFKTTTRIAAILKDSCGSLSRENGGQHVCEIVDEIEAEHELSARLSKIELALTYLLLNISLEAESASKNKLEEIHGDIKSMDKKLNMMMFDLSNIKIGSGNLFANLCAVRTELAKIAEMEKRSALKAKSVSKNSADPNKVQIALGNLIEAKVLELEEILKTKATKEDNQVILNKLEGLKPSAGFEWLGRIADVIAIFDASVKVFSFLM